MSLAKTVSHILSGDEVAEFIRKVENVNSGQQDQPAGYDVTVSRVYVHSKTPFTLGIQKTENSKLEELRPDPDGYFELGIGVYMIVLNEITSIPDNSIGLLLPRSTLLRNAIDVRTALFDPGYSGQPSIMLVCHRPLRLERFSRIGQLVLIRSDREFSTQYNGRYQGEGDIKK